MELFKKKAKDMKTKKKDKPAMFLLRIDKKDKKILERISKKTKRSLNSTILIAIEREIEKYKKEAE